MLFTAAHRENSQIPKWPRVSEVLGLKNLKKQYSSRQTNNIIDYIRF